MEQVDANNDKNHKLYFKALPSQFFCIRNESNEFGIFLS